MKNLFYLIVFLMLTGTTVEGIAQSRNSGVRGISIQAKSEKLRKATGWLQNTGGTWISNQNAISDLQLDEQNRNTIAQNFSWLQLVSIATAKQAYYVFLSENENYISGHSNERRVNYFIMDATAYSTLVSTVENKTAESISIHSSMFGFMSDKNEFSSARLVKLIEQTINSPSQDQYEFCINAQRVDNEDVVRFRLPELNSLLKTPLVKGYFETQWVEFNSLLLPLVDTNRNNEFDLNIPIPLSPKPAIEQPMQVVNQAREMRNDFNDTSIADNINNTADEVVEKQEAKVSNDEFGERTSYNKPILALQPFAILSNISGHYRDNASREWVGENSVQYKFETVGGYQMRDYSYKNQDYIVFTRKEKYAGELHMLIRKDEYVKAMLQFNELSKIKIPVIICSTLANTLEDMIELGEKAINTVPNEHTIIFKETSLVLQYKLSTTKGLARFYIYLENCSRYGSATASTNCLLEASNKIRYDDASLLGTDELFKKMYFETSYDSFVKFFKQPFTKNKVSDIEEDTNAELGF